MRKTGRSRKGYEKVPTEDADAPASYDNPEDVPVPQVLLDFDPAVRAGWLLAAGRWHGHHLAGPAPRPAPA